MTLKSQLESLLFALGRRTTVDELSRILRVRDHEKILVALQELEAEYTQKNGPIVVQHRDGDWKMTVHDEHLPMVRRVVTKTELPKGVMETLAVIAYKAPVLQSDIVKVRTNKAYDHLADLESNHLITREKHGRSKMIKLPKKFFDYFDIPHDKLKTRFGTVAALEQAIVDKEHEITTVQGEKEEQRSIAKAGEADYKKELAAAHEQVDKELAALPEIDLVDEEGHKEKLERYDSSVVDAPPTPELSKDIEVVNEPETYTPPRQARTRKKKEIPVAPPTPQETAEEVRQSLEHETSVEEAVAEKKEEADVDKFAVSSIEEEARKIAQQKPRATTDEGSKDFHAKLATDEVDAAVEERVEMMLGKKKEKPRPGHEHPETSSSAGDVHVTPEEGEKAERTGREASHAHPPQ